MNHLQRINARNTVKCEDVLFLSFLFIFYIMFFLCCRVGRKADLKTSCWKICASNDELKTVIVSCNAQFSGSL